MTSRRNWLQTALILAFLSVVAAHAEELETPAAAESAKDPTSVVRPTRVQPNSVTQQIETGPGAPVAALSLSAREQNMLNRSDEGLRARVLPNRAVALDLQGRFRNLATFTLDPETGEAVAACVTEMPAEILYETLHETHSEVFSESAASGDE